MTVLSYSQPGFPRKIKVGPDSCIAITYAQMTFLNETHIKAIRYKQISDSLSVASLHCDSLYRDGEELVKGLKSEVVLVKEKAIKLEELARKNYALYEQEQKKNKRLRTWMAVGGTGAGAVIITLVVGLLTK